MTLSDALAYMRACQDLFREDAEKQTIQLPFQEVHRGWYVDELLGSVDGIDVQSNKLTFSKELRIS